MEITHYPLHMMQGYEVSFEGMMQFLDQVVTARELREPALQAVSKHRRSLLPFGAVAMKEVLSAMKPSLISSLGAGCARGISLFAAVGGRAPRRSAACRRRRTGDSRARSPEHARELAEWTGRMMPLFGIQETEEESRYRQAACLLADISWRAHPDYRGLQALNVIAHSSFVGISHPGRAFIALSNYYRFEGLHDDGATGPLAQIATPSSSSAPSCSAACCASSTSSRPRCPVSSRT